MKQPRAMAWHICQLKKRLPDLNVVDGQAFFAAWMRAGEDQGTQQVQRILVAGGFDPKRNGIDIDSPMAARC